MYYKYVIGMDTSKNSFDMAVLSAKNSEAIFHNAFSNDGKGFDEMMRFITSTMPDFESSKALFCMEATGK